MAHNDPAPRGGHGTPDSHAAGGAHAAAHDAHAHPTWKQYKWVALILTLITVVEVWVYYIPSFTRTKLFVPSLLIMSAVKFAIVVMFYMHLKFDHKLFTGLFVFSLGMAIFTIIVFIGLFHGLIPV